MLPINIILACGCYFTLALFIDSFIISLILTKLFFNTVTTTTIIIIILKQSILITDIHFLLQYYHK
jgi:hypothetical protein